MIDIKKKSIKPSELIKGVEILKIIYQSKSGNCDKYYNQFELSLGLIDDKVSTQ